MVVKIFVTQCQPIETLPVEFLDGVIDETAVTRVVEAGSEGARKSQRLIDLAQQKRAPIGGKGAARKIGDHFART